MFWGRPVGPPAAPLAASVPLRRPPLRHSPPLLPNHFQGILHIFEVEFRRHLAHRCKLWKSGHRELVGHFQHHCKEMPGQLCGIAPQDFVIVFKTSIVLELFYRDLSRRKFGYIYRPFTTFLNQKANPSQNSMSKKQTLHKMSCLKTK